MEDMPFTFGSLFSGIGGLDLGLERANMQCAWQCEINDYATKVLEKHWPNVTRFRDVRTAGKHNLTAVDLIAGGPPCQPHSLAGERKASKDERNLWPEFYRIICELRPRWVLVENVLGLLSSEGGQFFGGILRDLAQARYDAEWCVLSAAQFGAPHLRERVFIVAHTTGARQQSQQDTRRCSVGFNTTSASHVADVSSFRSDARRTEPETQHRQSNTHSTGEADVADTSGQRREECDASAWYSEQGQRTRLVEKSRVSREPESVMGRIFDGISTTMDGYRWPAGPGEQHAWEPPRVTTEKLAHRVARLEALGNAVVPQIAEAIGRRILDLHENSLASSQIYREMEIVR